MKFEYRPVKVFDADIEIEDIGQCCLEVTDSFNQLYYLIIRTTMGSSEIFEYGPIFSLECDEILTNNIVCKISKIEFSPAKVKKIISLFLMDRAKGQCKTELVRTLSVKEALSNCVDLINYMRKYENDDYDVCEKDIQEFNEKDEE